MTDHDLVLGATGDLGQELLDRLDDPVGVSRSDEPGLDVETVTADITEEVPELEQYDTVYHLATLNSYGHPAPAEESPDVAGTRNLVDAMNELDDDERPDLVYVSSAAAIDPDPASDGVGYGEAKALGEAEAARLEGSTIVRPGSVYGDGKGAIAYFLEQADDGEDLPLYGDGSQKRSFVHIDDAADAIAGAGRDERIEVAEDTYTLNDVTDIFEDAADIGREYDHSQETSDVTLTGGWEQYETERSLEEYIQDQV